EDAWPDDPSGLAEGADPLVVAESLRELGNQRFREGRHKEAVRVYEKARSFLPAGAPPAPDAGGDDRAALARACSVAVMSNAAMCRLKMDEHDACVRLCDSVLSLDPRNAKAFFRKALALRALDDDDGAEVALRQAADLAPEDAAVRRELAEVASRRRREKEGEKRLAQKMFG
ncbi:unnamed protein product, partial [Prorocentrum cordatum]